MREMAGNIQRINFVVKHPNEKENRATFVILKVTHFNDGTNKKAEKVEDDRIKAINEEWKNSTKTEPKKKELLELVNEIQADLHKRQRIKDGKVRLIRGDVCDFSPLQRSDVFEGLDVFRGSTFWQKFTGNHQAIPICRNGPKGGSLWCLCRKNAFKNGP